MDSAGSEKLKGDGKWNYRGVTWFSRRLEEKSMYRVLKTTVVRECPAINDDFRAKQGSC
jgi:hypothetical protein